MNEIKDENGVTVKFSKADELRLLVEQGNVVLVTAEALTPPSGLGVLHAIGEFFLVLDPLPNEDEELEEEMNLMPVLYRTIVPVDTIKLVLKLREYPKPQINNARYSEEEDEETAA